MRSLATFDRRRGRQSAKGRAGLEPGRNEEMRNGESCNTGEQAAHAAWVELQEQSCKKARKQHGSHEDRHDRLQVIEGTKSHSEIGRGCDERHGCVKKRVVT